jgi:hypothetical protein
VGLVSPRQPAGPGKVVPARGCGHIGNETVARESQPSNTEGFSMSAEIFDFKEAKERRHRDMIIKAKYASMLSNEILFADEAETVDREVQEGQPPNNKKD